MKLTNKQIKKIIKEELDDLLSRSYKFGPYFQKLKMLMIADLEAYNQGVELFHGIKGSGMLNPEEEEALQKIYPIQYSLSCWCHLAIGKPVFSMGEPNHRTQQLKRLLNRIVMILLCKIFYDVCRVKYDTNRTTRKSF